MKKLIKTLFSFLIVNICIFTLFSHAQNDNAATLVDWKTFNAKIKTLSAWKSQNYKDYWNKITTIKESKTQPWNWIIKDNISTSESLPIRVRYDNDTIYYYSNAKEIYLNSDSSEMFYNFIKLNDISWLKNRDASNVKNMYNMFAGCYNITNTSPLKDWDVSNVTNMAGTFVILIQKTLQIWQVYSIIVKN